MHVGSIMQTTAVPDEIINDFNWVTFVLSLEPIEHKVLAGTAVVHELCETVRERQLLMRIVSGCGTDVPVEAHCHISGVGT